MRIMPLALALLLVRAAALGPGTQDYPCSQVKLVVPYPAGGATDVASRVVAERLEAVLKKPFFVENRGGATGNIGTVAVVTAPADGCTVLVNATIIATFIHSFTKLSYDPFKDLAPVGGIGVTPTLIVAAAVGPRERHQGPRRVEQDQARRPQLQHRRIWPAAAPRVGGDRAAHRREVHSRRLSRRRHRHERSDRRAARFRRLPRRHDQAADCERQAQGNCDRRRKTLRTRARHSHNHRTGLAGNELPRCAFHDVRARRNSQAGRGYSRRGAQEVVAEPASSSASSASVDATPMSADEVAAAMRRPRRNLAPVIKRLNIKLD